MASHLPVLVRPELLGPQDSALCGSDPGHRGTIQNLLQLVRDGRAELWITQNQKIVVVEILDEPNHKIGPSYQTSLQINCAKILIHPSDILIKLPTLVPGQTSVGTVLGPVTRRNPIARITLGPGTETRRAPQGLCRNRNSHRSSHRCHRCRSESLRAPQRLRHRSSHLGGDAGRAARSDHFQMCYS